MHRPLTLTRVSDYGQLLEDLVAQIDVLCLDNFRLLTPGIPPLAPYVTTRIDSPTDKSGLTISYTSEDLDWRSGTSPFLSIYMVGH